MSLMADIYVEAAAEITQDTDYDTWSIVQWVRWLNDALDAINVVRPDAFSQVALVSCITGSRQVLGAGQVRIIDLIRNMGVDGVTPGRAITGPVDRQTMSAQEPNWTIAGAVNYVRQYAYDTQVPDVFWVVPPLSGSTSIEGAIVVEPTWIADPVGTTNDDKITALSSVNVDLNRRYKPAAIEWMCFRAFERDSERSPNWAKAARHLQFFFQLLGRKLEVDNLMIDPRVVSEGMAQ